ncbi:MAG: hypothetical protein NTZ60_07615 [Campylobacterales bacterium]|nr:hypothetical protein [Campylobacterales bacterium]
MRKFCKKCKLKFMACGFPHAIQNKSFNLYFFITPQISYNPICQTLKYIHLNPHANNRN